MNSQIAIVTGEENAGKSTLCRELMKYAHEKGLKVSGLVSELFIKDNQKTAIYTMNIKTGEKIQLAIYSPGWDKKKPERKWKFNSGVFKWGNQVLKGALPSDVIIIDEIGYQEFENKKGWNSCFKVLNEGLYKLAILVIRKDLLPQAIKIWNNVSVFKINKLDKDTKASKEIKSMIDQLLIE